MWLLIAKTSYDAGWYTKETVAEFVEGGVITKDDYKSIVGEPYPEPETKLAEPVTATAEPETKPAEPETKSAEPVTVTAEPETESTEPVTESKDNGTLDKEVINR